MLACHSDAATCLHVVKHVHCACREHQLPAAYMKHQLPGADLQGLTAPKFRWFPVGARSTRIFIQDHGSVPFHGALRPTVERCRAQAPGQTSSASAVVWTRRHTRLGMSSTYTAGHPLSVASSHAWPSPPSTTICCSPASYNAAGHSFGRRGKRHETQLRAQQQQSTKDQAALD